jgi:phosphoribosyl 1,2-cyclic phosphate phosphodiesterase
VEGSGGERIVVDTGPEFRLQAVRAGLTALDALLITHTHADHLHGLDDVRPLTVKTPLTVYSSEQALAEIRSRFPYIFKAEGQIRGARPRLCLRAVSGGFQIGGITVTPLPVTHGALEVLGWKFSEGARSAVYITDASAIPGPTATLASGCDLLIIGALRAEPHATHFSFGEALLAAKSIGSGRVFLTHINHEHSHREIEAFCCDWAAANGMRAAASPAFDGLTVEV